MPFLPGKFDKCPQLGMTLPSQKKNLLMPSIVGKAAQYFFLSNDFVLSIICRWYKDIGLEHAASRPLLKTVFQVHI